MTPEENTQKQRKLDKAYRSVFGRNGNRTDAQKMVLAHLEKCVWDNSWIPHEGSVCPYRAAISEGRRTLSIEIIQRANTVPSEETEKPTVRK